MRTTKQQSDQDFLDHLASPAVQRALNGHAEPPPRAIRQSEAHRHVGNDTTVRLRLRTVLILVMCAVLGGFTTWAVMIQRDNYQQIADRHANEYVADAVLELLGPDGDFTHKPIDQRLDGLAIITRRMLPEADIDDAALRAWLEEHIDAMD